MAIENFRVGRALLIAVLLMATPLRPAWSQQPAPAPPPLFAQLQGRWAVEQTTWTGPDAPAKKGPSAIATRRIPAGGGFVEEEMTISATENEPFTRMAWINYNVTARAFEYASVDSRAPQQISYRSQSTAPTSAGALAFRGGTFVAAEFGGRTNVAFAYRVELSPATGGRQALKIFFKPVQGEGREILATRYDYRRLP